MRQFVLPLEGCASARRRLVGQKARVLGKLIQAGLKVPTGLCLTTQCYLTYIRETGLQDLIMMEIGRKNYEDMRWEEHWDAALRIRHHFLKTSLPARLGALLKKSIETEFQGQAIALRSSASAEDLAEASFAGLYESYLNMKTWKEIERHIRLVWASLWSDAALLYQNELKLDVKESAMAVICQSMVPSDKAGVAFSRNPLNANEALIEAVFGLNQGLVDGDVEPDRWNLDRETGHILTAKIAEHSAQMSPASRGVVLQTLRSSQASDPVLSTQEIAQVFSDLKRVENLFRSPQDMEWTFQGNSLYILQARPITTHSRKENADRRSFDLSLRRSFTNLQKLGERIEKEWLPAILDEADSFSQIQLDNLSDAALATEIENRRHSYKKWKTVYWEDFIPFAHGTRLFGQIYNEHVKPADPYEFVQLLTSSKLESLKRNQELEKLAQTLKPFLEKQDFEHLEKESAWQKKINDFLSRHNHLACQLEECHEEQQALWNILQEMAKMDLSHSPAKPPNKEQLVKKYLSTFDEEESEYAQRLLALAKKSYRLRDDDNIYLGRIEALLQAALGEARSRSRYAPSGQVLQGNIEEALRALRWNPLGLKGSEDSDPGEPQITLNARQLRGQPAGPGIARGPARVILKNSDLFDFKQQEILVCDAIDPNMTFAIPVAAAIVERRGGMLIHGAIIAREYGIPCVTGIPRATEFIQTGDHLTVDGYYGLVIIHSDKKEVQRA
jgi:pyruvate,water dikinase